MVALELAVVGLLIVLNGFLAMAELAVVSARRARLAAMAEAGGSGARRALRLLENPARFLSSVQIGITLVGVLAGAFGGATLAGRLAGYLVTLGLAAGPAETVAVALVVAAITYLSLIVGELVPKQIALADPERVAAFVAAPMTAIARVAAPAVLLLEVSSRLVLRLLGRNGEQRQQVTEEEIRALVAEGQSAGVVESAEGHMIDRVMRLGDRSVRGIMTPRPEVDWVDIAAEVPTVVARLRASPHSRLPAARGLIDDLAGVIHAKDVFDALAASDAPDLPALVRAAPAIHDGADALDALSILRTSPVDMAFVVDEHGTFEGVITAADLLEAIAGQFAAGDGVEPAAMRREDGSWLLSGWQPVDEMADKLEIRLPDRRGYHTVAGFALAQLGRFPALGEAFETSGWRFEVIDIDGRRVDKLLAMRLGQQAHGSAGGAAG